MVERCATRTTGVVPVGGVVFLGSLLAAVIHVNGPTGLRAPAKG
jgi:hypothetical protein